MENIQILFFSGMITANIFLYFFIFWREKNREKRVKTIEENYVKVVDLYNSLFEKLKEVVVKVNPLIAAYDDNSDKNNEVYDVKETSENGYPLEENREFPKSSLHQQVLKQMGVKNEK